MTDLTEINVRRLLKEIGRASLRACDTALVITVALMAPTHLFDLLPDREIIVGGGFAFVAAFFAMWAAVLLPKRHH